MLTGWEVLVAPQSVGPEAAESRLSRSRRRVFLALRGDSDWDLGMYDGDLALLRLSRYALPPRLLPRVWGGFL